MSLRPIVPKNACGLNILNYERGKLPVRKSDVAAIGTYKVVEARLGHDASFEKLPLVHVLRDLVRELVHGSIKYWSELSFVTATLFYKQLLK